MRFSFFGMEFLPRYQNQQILPTVIVYATYTKYLIIDGDRVITEAF